MAGVAALQLEEMEEAVFQEFMSEAFHGLGQIPEEAMIEREISYEPSPYLARLLQRWDFRPWLDERSILPVLHVAHG